jgi:DNA-binding GntR family transcriptional regulator
LQGVGCEMRDEKAAQSVYTFYARRYHRPMDATATSFIVESLTRAIVAHRLQPGAKLVEQKLADQYGVSRTLVRQALYRLSHNRLIRIEPARGAFVAAPSATEARQVFAVRRMLEAGMVRAFVAQAKSADIKALQTHIAQEKQAVHNGDVPGRTALLGDFHVRMAQLLHNEVLAHMLSDLISRSALITLMYQTSSAAAHSHEEHEAIFKAIKARDADAAVALLDAHLCNVEQALNFKQHNALAS